MRTVSSFSALFSPLCILLTSGCLSTVVCPEGTRAVMGACVGDDAGVPDGGADDAMAADAFVDDATVPTDGGLPVDAPADARGVDAPSDACTLLSFFADADEDGFGDESVVMMGCVAPAGFIAEGGDCDDANELVSPMATEACDMAMVDEDCDGTMNEGCECYVGQTRGCPGESDVGECVAGTQTCDATGHWPATCVGTVTARVELCDNVDNDCDGATDDGIEADAACGSWLNGASDCVLGTCNRSCTTDYADCNSFSAGCETRLGSATACTRCGDACAWSCGSSTTGCNDPVRMSLGIGAASNTTCAIRSPDDLYCWGENSNGEVGTGTTGSVGAPVAVRSLSGTIVDSASGATHSCAVVATGRVYCWGENGEGQIGDNTLVSRLTPTLVSGITTAVEVVAGFNFTCARLLSGAVQCWGYNIARQLGVDDTMRRVVPTNVVGVSDATSLSASTLRVCATRAGGTVVCWGSGHTGRASTTIPGGLAATKVATGLNHTCAIAGGEVFCWGGNEAGELGNGGTTPVSSPIRIGTWRSRVVGDVAAVDITAGNEHTCVAGSNGSLACWGSNSSGQVGNASMMDALGPVYLTSVTGVFDVEAGALYTCALSQARPASPSDPAPPTSMYCWGENGSGELGHSMTTDVRVPTLVSRPL